MSLCDHIVVGAGINGISTAYQLAKRGAKVLVLEKFPLPHSRGSSYGQSRIIRRAYPDPFFARLMEEAYDQWDEIEKLSGTKLLQETGLLCFSNELDNPVMSSIIKSFASNPAAKNTVYDGPEFQEKYPCIDFGDQSVTGCYDPDAGILMADKSLRAIKDLAKSFGAKIIDGFEVEDIKVYQDSVHVTGGGFKKKTFTCKSIVLAPGPWAPQILDMIGLELPLRPQKIPVYYWKVKDFIPYSFIYDGDGTHIFGLPPLEYPDLFKICVHGGPDIDPDSRDQISTEDYKQFLQTFIKSHFPGVEPLVSVEEACIYTVTPDWNPVIDTVPGYQNVVLAVGFSGTGFKLGPVVGRMCADMAQGLVTQQKDSVIGIRRFMDRTKL